jgi:hypothetical protein
MVTGNLKNISIIKYQHKFGHKSYWHSFKISASTIKKGHHLAMLAILLVIRDKVG